MTDELTEKSLLTQEKLCLKAWGIPRMILEKYAAKGIENMFPWQVECLTCEGVLSGKNLVYSAPTSAGKTMVAEILTIQTVMERKKKVIIILPFISVVREKMLYFQNLLGSSGVRVEGFMGSHAPPGGLKTVHIAICTIEKANSLINRLLEDQGLDAVGCVVVDEVHLLGDPNRGYLLELLLTKLKYMCLKNKTMKIQIVGMSATLPNIDELAMWLDAALYTTQFRPVPLTEYLKVNSGVYDASTLELKYNIQPIVKFKSDPGDVIHLCLESLLSGHSVVVFCPTRNWCETSAQQISAEFRRIGYEKGEVGLKVREQLDGDAISDVLEQLKRCPAGLDQALGRSIAFGVAFHHAGLTMDERDIVEGAFRTSVLRVLVATSTLSSGVNLPARRVLVRCPSQKAVDILSYRQMVGRAGRMGKDTAGESFLICNGSERILGEQLVKAQLPPVESSLGIGDLSSSLKRAILEVIASGVVSTSEDVEAYTSCTFLASCSTDNSQLGDPLAACVEYLQNNEFIRVTGNVLGPTPLAEACLSASLPPDQGLKLLKELHRARQCFVLESELHVIYQVTPYSVSDQWGQLDWLRVLSLWEDLPISMKRVGELVGVEERFLVRAVRGTINTQAHDQKLSIHRRFYTALALQDLVNEVPLPQVSVKFDCTKGMLQSLQQSASTFAGMVTQFSRRLGWSNVELLVSQFCARLQFGAQRELLDLLRLDCLTAVQARALYNSGIQGLADLATATSAKVEKALSRATPFQSENEDTEGSDKCRIWLVGRCAATEAQAATILIQECRQYLERELGLQSANWGDLNSTLESSASESLITQSLETPPRPIGQEVVETNKGGEVKSYTKIENKKEDNSCHNTVESAYNKNANKDSEIKETDVQDKNIHTKLNTNVGTPTLIKEEEKVNTSNFNQIGGAVDKEGIQANNISPKQCSNTLLIGEHCIENFKKRGSLDLFDSPERLDFNLGCDNKSGINIEEGNMQLNPSIITNIHTLNNLVKKENTPVKGDESSQIHARENSATNQANKESNISEENLKMNIPGGGSVSFVNENQNSLTPNNQSFSNKSVFFDSPLPIELVQANESSVLDQLDANIGGESLLEMSFITVGNEEINKFDVEEEINKSNFEGINLLDANVGGESLLEMSSFDIGTEKRKRKHSTERLLLSKKLKTDKSLVRISAGKSELQVSKISSTNCNLKPNKTSTPTLSQYFEGSFSFNSPFLVEENGNINDKSKIKNEVFMNVDSSDVHSTNFDPEDGSSDENNLECTDMEELQLSPHKSKHDLLCDSEFNIDSKICDLLDRKDHSFKDKSQHEGAYQKNIIINESCEKSYSFSGNINIDSKLNECLDVRTIVAVKSDSDREKLSSKSSYIPADNIITHEKSFKINVDSKQNALVVTEVVKNTEKTPSESNLFTSELNLNTQLCGLIDQGNCKSGNNVNSKDIQREFPQFLNSDFDINTQLCNALDNITSGEKHVNMDKSPKAESLEIKEKTKFNVDEDTVFGTPVTHHKSVSIKHFAAKKSKIGRINTQVVGKKLKNGDQSNLSNKNNESDDFPSSAIIQDHQGLETMKYQENKNSNVPINDNVSVDRNVHNECNKKLLFPVNIDSRSEKENKVFVNCETTELADNNPPTTGYKHSLISNTFLEGAFQSSFNQQTSQPGDDEVASSQKSPDTPHKTLRERVQNINSPTVNMNSTQTQVVRVSVSDAAARREFQKSMLARKSVALALAEKTVENNGGGVIGARIINKRSESGYPCVHQGRVITEVVVCWGGSKVYTLSLDQKNCDGNLDLLREMLSRKELTVCMWEAKHVVKLLHQCCHLQCDVRLSDPTIAEWLLKPHGNTPTLKQLARTYGVSAPQCSVEIGFQALLIWELSHLLKGRLKQAGLYSSYIEVEMPTQSLLAGMEMVGVQWDREYADLLWTSVEEKMAELQNTLFHMSGKKFNVRSRTDLAKIKGSLKELSEKVMVEFNKVLRNWRVLNSLKVRNMSPLLMLEGHRISGHWETHTVTGRISMQEPSLQNVPRDIVIDDQVFSMRSAFIACPGHTLVSADFCQLELRLLAHFSQDPTLHDTFSKPGDVFTSIAAGWNNVPPDQITDSMRQHTKQLCYGLIYGMGIRTLAEEMGLSEQEAGEMAESFHSTYPGIQSYVAKCVEQCRSRGYVTTIMGRKRFLPEINSHNKSLKAQAERQAVNTTIQGSAADIAKVAMLRVDRTVRRRHLQAHLIINLHDELIYEVAEKNINEFVNILRTEMENSISVSVPLPVKVKSGPSWGQLELIE